MTLKMGIETCLIDKIPKIMAVEQILDTGRGLELNEDNVEKIHYQFQKEVQMERLLQTKRRRVYSVEPVGRRIQVQSLFAREYMKYLVPALSQIRNLKHSSENNNGDVLKNKVKYEADMALALSARGLAWSNALRNELQTDITEPQKSNSDIVEQQARTGSILWCRDQTGQLAPGELIKPNPSVWPLIEENKKEEEHTNVKLKSLRLLIPGGDKMGDDEEMLAELVSYISCLKMQVEVLQSLVHVIEH